MSDDLVKKLREKPWRGGSESNDEAQIRRQKEREDGADLIEAQAAEITRLRTARTVARLEGIGEAVSQARARADFWSSGNNKEAKIRHDEARKIAAAISAAAKDVK